MINLGVNTPLTHGPEGHCPLTINLGVNTHITHGSEGHGLLTINLAVNTHLTHGTSQPLDYVYIKYKPS